MHQVYKTGTSGRAVDPAGSRRKRGQASTSPAPTTSTRPASVNRPGSGVKALVHVATGRVLWIIGQPRGDGLSGMVASIELTSRGYQVRFDPYGTLIFPSKPFTIRRITNAEEGAGG